MTSNATPPLSDRRIHVRESGADVLAAIGLATVEDVRAFRGGEVVSAGKRRVVRRLVVDDRAFYLEQVHDPPRASLRERLRGQGSATARAASCLEALAAAGIPASVPLAWGGRRGFCFLVVEPVEGFDLASYFHGDAALPRTRANDLRVGTALAGFIRRLADAGCYPIDLTPKHLAVRIEEGGIEFAIAAVGRLRRSAPANPDHVAEILARLEVSTSRSEVSSADRFRFIDAVGMLERRDMLHLIEQLTHRLRRRRRHCASLGTTPHSDPVWRRSADGHTAWTGPFVDEPDPERARRDGYRVTEGDRETMARLIGICHALNGWVNCAEFLAWRLDPRGGASWIIRSPRGVPVAKMLKRIPHDELRAGFERALRALLALEILPAGPVLLDWFFWDVDGLHVVPTRDILPEKRVSYDPGGELLDALRLELRLAGAAPHLVDLLTGDVDLRLRGVLGAVRRYR